MLEMTDEDLHGMDVSQEERFGFRRLVVSGPSWRTGEVSAWLEANGAGAVAAIVVEHVLGGVDLLTISPDDLEQCGISAEESATFESLVAHLNPTAPGEWSESV